MTQVTMYVPADTWRKFRAKCVQDGTSASQVLSAEIAARLAAAGIPTADIMDLAAETEPTHADA
jgi:hypothetical protein